MPDAGGLTFTSPSTNVRLQLDAGAGERWRLDAGALTSAGAGRARLSLRSHDFGLLAIIYDGAITESAELRDLSHAAMDADPRALDRLLTDWSRP